MRIVGLIGILAILFSCNKKVVFEEYKMIQKQQWHTDSLVIFNYIIEDTIIPHKVVLKIRHGVEYEYQNLFLFIQSQEEKDTIEIIIADKRGKWIGTGVGDLREIEINLENKKIYPNKQKQKMIIEQAMRYGARLIN